MNDTITLEINNWEKYNPRKDIKSTSWLRLQNNILEDPDLFNFSHSEICAFIYILCIASKKNSGIFSVRYDHAERISRIKRSVLDETIKKLNDLNIVTVHVTSTLRERHVHDTLRTNETRRNETERDETDATEPNSANADSFPEIYDSLFDDWFKTLKREIIEGWIATYQDTGWIKQEILKAKTWCIANQTKAPKSNYARFITNWLARGFESYRKGIQSQPVNKAELRDQHNIDAARDAAKLLKERNEQRRKSNQ